MYIYIISQLSQQKFNNGSLNQLLFSRRHRSGIAQYLAFCLYTQSEIYLLHSPEMVSLPGTILSCRWACEHRALAKWQQEFKCSVSNGQIFKYVNQVGKMRNMEKGTTTSFLALQRKICN